MTSPQPIATTVTVHGDGRFISTSLEAPHRVPQAITVDLSNYPLDDDTPYQARIHHGDHTARRAVIHALRDAIDAYPHPIDSVDRDQRPRLIAKIADCCKYPSLFQRPDGSLVLHQSRCKSRVCPRCGRLRILELRSKLLDRIQTYDDPRFVTLTISPGNQPLRAQIKHLAASFRRLRQTKRWQRKSRRGIYIVEITYNAAKQLWHPHLHVVVDGDYYDQAQLSDDWSRASGGSPIVDIRRISKRSDIAQYLTQYLAKSQAPANLKRPQLAEWAMSLKGLRMVQPFGAHDRADPIDHDSTDSPGPAKRIGSIIALMIARDAGDLRAARLLHTIHLIMDVSDDDPRHCDTRRLVQRLRIWAASRDIAGRRRDNNTGTTREPRNNHSATTTPLLDTLPSPPDNRYRHD